MEKLIVSVNMPSYPQYVNVSITELFRNTELALEWTLSHLINQPIKIFDTVPNATNASVPLANDIASSLQVASSGASESIERCPLLVGQKSYKQFICKTRNESLGSYLQGKGQF